MFLLTIWRAEKGWGGQGPKSASGWKKGPEASPAQASQDPKQQPEGTGA